MEDIPSSLDWIECRQIQLYFYNRCMDKARRNIGGMSVVVLWLGFISTATLRAQQGNITTLHVTTRLVAVSAVVTEKNGEPHAGLTKDDFILKQDGREQSIRYLSQGDQLPLTFVVMIDTSGSQFSFLGDEQRACDVFFETVMGRAQDRAVLVEVNREVIARSNLTNSANDLHLALYGLNSNRTERTATRLTDAIYTVSKSVLAKVTGRKAIILLSDGGENGSVVKREEAIAEAQRDNVPVYSISYSAWNGFRSPNSADPGLANLQDWSKATGGHVYEVSYSMPLKRIFENIAEELRSQYEIGYMLPADTKPGAFHKLELKTKNKQLKVQARTGFYVAP